MLNESGAGPGEGSSGDVPMDGCGGSIPTDRWGSILPERRRWNGGYLNGLQWLGRGTVGEDLRGKSPALGRSD